MGAENLYRAWGLGIGFLRGWAVAGQQRKLSRARVASQAWATRGLARGRGGNAALPMAQIQQLGNTYSCASRGQNWRGPKSDADALRSP